MGGSVGRKNYRGLFPQPVVKFGRLFDLPASRGPGRHLALPATSTELPPSRPTEVKRSGP